MKKSGFTLAEILISLMILGVIASLTIPSLIQNTQKREEVVKLKKGASMINQALAMNYSLTGKYVEEYKDSSENLLNMFKNRLSIVDSSTSLDFPYFTTQDGLTYAIEVTGSYDPEIGEVNDESYSFLLYLSTKPFQKGDNINDYVSTNGKIGEPYLFFCALDRCVPSESTAKIMNAADPTKISEDEED